MPGAQTERLLTEVGRSFEAGSDKPFLFSGGGGWYVRSGSVDVFSVRVEGGQAVGSRSHFFRAGAGQFLFGLGGNGERTVGLLAVGTSGTQMIEVDQEQLRRLAASSAHSDHMAVMVDGWVEALCSSITGGKILDECVVIEAGEHAAADGEAARVRPSKSTLWIRSEDGAARLLGREGLEVAASSLTPISRHAWLEVPPRARIVAQPSRALIGRDELWAGLGQLHDLVLDYVVQRDRQAVAEERERLRQKVAADRSTFAEACASIAETLDTAAERQRRRPAGAQLSSGGDDLVTACGMLADSLGIEIRPLPPGDGAIPRDPLAALARASRFRTRQVLLRDEWWRSDGGPMLAYLKEPRRPVVLMSTRSGYVMRDPADGSETRVKAELADQLEPQAHSFYRPFREHALSLVELVKFGLGGCGRDVATVVLMGAATGLLGLVTPIVTGILFNDVIPGADRPQLLQLTLIMLVIAVATTLFNASGTIALVRVDGRMGASIQSAVWDRLLALPMPFFRRYTAGDLASRAMGIDSIRQVLSGAVVTSLLTGLFSLFHFVLLFHYSERLAWWAVVIIAIAVSATAVAGRLQLTAERAVAEIRTKLSGAVLQFLSSIGKLRVAGAEIKAFSLWAQGFSRQRRHRFRARAVSNALASFNAGFPLAAQLALFAFAVPLLTADVPLRTGDFLAFMVSFATCLGGMLSASGALIGAATVIPLYEQATPILATPPEVDSGKADPGTLAGHIEMQSLRFRYQPDGPLILDDVKLTIRPGEFVALVGPSGSGKSTILRLLLGFEEPEAGAIFYDGQELAGLDNQAVRSQIGVVLQNGRLMPGDIFSNIVGSSLATLDDAWGAARMAGLDADIEAMPMGMHTVISEGGGTLSGGQRQRLMIARALVRRPKLLYFDEATSALDNRTQSIVSESLDRMQSTRVVVAHRLSTIIHADRIYVLEAGKVVQSGTYEELLAREGLFRELAMRQIA